MNGAQQLGWGANPMSAMPAMSSLIKAATMGELRNLIGEMRALAPLPEDAQKIVDDAVVRVGRNRLTIVSDLMDEGLVFPVPDAMGVMEVTWDQLSEAGGAIRSMSPRARNESGLPDRRQKKIPVYLTMDGFSLDARTLMASQRVGSPLDTTMIEQSTRRVNEAVEDAAINGAITVDGNASPGLMNAPNVNSITYLSNEAWDAAGKNGEEILTDVLSMIAVLQADGKFGPYTLYVNTTYGNALNANWSDGTTTFPITIRARLEQIEAGGRNLRVKVADRLATNRTALVQMTSDVVDLIQGQSPVAVPWMSPDGWTFHWMIMAIQIPRTRDDYDGQSGIVTGNI